MTPKPLSKSQITELVVNALELADRSDSRIVYDAKLPDIDTGDLRQIDVAVFSYQAGRLYLRIVEVKDWQKRVGVAVVDQQERVMQRIGAHRLTLVSTSGFTAGALSRIRQAPHQADAFTLITSAPDYWPPRVRSRRIRLEGEHRETVRLSHARYLNALTDELQYDVLYGTWRSARMVFALLLSPGSEDIAKAVKARFIALDRGRSHRLRSVEFQFKTDECMRHIP